MKYKGSDYNINVMRIMHMYVMYIMQMYVIYNLISMFVFAYAQNCTLVVPEDPLSSIGLSTPYIYKNCDQTDIDQASFIEAVILNKYTGNLRIYTPLIINENTTPLLPTIIPNITPDDIVGIWFGSNANSLTLISNGISLIIGQCINGISYPVNIFGQVAACNAINFFNVANTLIKLDVLKIPFNGNGLNGNPCYTVRSFQVVDQDQSDNVISTYLVYGNRLAQYSIDNQNTINSNSNGTNVTVLSNGSDNGLLDNFILPSLNCTPFTALDIVSNQYRGAQALNELYAMVNQLSPQALIPINDPMVLDNNNINFIKTNAYRQIVNQPIANNITDACTITYCQNLINIGLPSIVNDMIYTQLFNSPNTNIASNLYTFLGNRLFNTLSPNGLNCTGLLNITNPITPILTNDVVTSLDINNSSCISNITSTPASSLTSTPVLTPVSTLVSTPTSSIVLTPTSTPVSSLVFTPTSTPASSLVLTPTSTPSLNSTCAGVLVTVKNGDTCSQIAINNGATVGDVVFLNQDICGGINQNKLQIGTFICVVPGVAGTNPIINADLLNTNTYIQTNPNCKIVGLINTGATCTSIAQFLGITINQFISINNQNICNNLEAADAICISF